MHWSVLILLAGIINASVNFGYKIKAAQDNVFLISACVLAISSICLFGFHACKKGGINFSEIATGYTPLVIAGMGVGSSLTLYLFVSALAKGPYSIIDPMLACVYTLTSVLIGIAILRETPGLYSLVGVVLYLGAAILMSRAH